MKINVPAVFLLLALKNALPQYTVHIFHPWTTDSQRSVQPVHIASPTMSPGIPGTPMQAESRSPWHKFTWSESQFRPNSGFYFISYIPSQFDAYANAQYLYNGGDQFNVNTIFPFGTKEVWIVPNGADKATLHTEPPWYQGSKIALIFNPWPKYAPTAKVNGDSVYSIIPMVQDPGRCGWYRVNFPDSVRKVHFKSSFGSEIFGLGGMGSNQVIDLTSDFATADTIFLLPEPYPHGAPKMLPSFPNGMSGICRFQVVMTVRDFSLNHPDFQFAKPIDSVSRGMVSGALGPDRKPVQGPNRPIHQNHFETWFNTDSAHADSSLRNHETCKDLLLSKTAKGGWGYDSYNEPSHSFFPIDDFNWFGETSRSMYVDRQGVFHPDPTAKEHNFHFCLEMHAGFTYEKGQSLAFAGDDDAWIFIDNKLALDLGGTHSIAQGEINFDQLGLTVGKEYHFDFFLCERQSEGSNLTLETSAYLVQSDPFVALRTKLPDGAVRYSIYESRPAMGRCVPPAGDTIPAVSRFTLEGPSILSAALLEVGTSYGGITVAATRTELTIDSTRIEGLLSGLYVINYTSERTGRTGRFSFTVPGTVSVGRPLAVVRPDLKVYTMGGHRVKVQFQPGGAWNGKGLTEVKVMSLHGSAVYRKAIPGTGTFTESIDGAGFKRGVYLVVVKSGNRRFSKRVVIP